MDAKKSKQLKTAKAKRWLNKNFPQGWNVKWQDEDLEVKSLARIIKL